MSNFKVARNDLLAGLGVVVAILYLAISLVTLINVDHLLTDGKSAAARSSQEAAQSAKLANQVAVKSAKAIEVFLTRDHETGVGNRALDCDIVEVLAMHFSLAPSSAVTALCQPPSHPGD